MDGHMVAGMARDNRSKGGGVMGCAEDQGIFAESRESQGQGSSGQATGYDAGTMACETCLIPLPGCYDFRCPNCVARLRTHAEIEKVKQSHKGAWA